MSAWRQKAEQGLIRTVHCSDHIVREYPDRLAIWRKDGERLTWEELQQAKQLLWGGRIAIEVYPAEADVVNLRHTRHLWSTPLIESTVRRECQHAEFSGGRKSDD